MKRKLHGGNQPDQGQQQAGDPVKPNPIETSHVFAALNSAAWKRGANFAPESRMTPEIPAAAKATQKAICKEPVLSEMRPISVGEKASPSRWMINTFTASAVERMLALTEFTHAALVGPVPIRMKNTAAKIAGNIKLPLA